MPWRQSAHHGLRCDGPAVACERLGARVMELVGEEREYGGVLYEPSALDGPGAALQKQSARDEAQREGFGLCGVCDP